eukprot:1159929-Pelagomonas_calceolata.AAC.16
MGPLAAHETLCASCRASAQRHLGCGHSQHMKLVCLTVRRCKAPSGTGPLATYAQHGAAPQSGGRAWGGP